MPHTLYQINDSGNCYKIRLLAAHLKLPLKLVEVDITKGESRTTSFLSKNTNGKVPTLELETGEFLSESNAILWYLSSGTPFQPTNRFDQAKVLQWFGFEQYSHEPNIATSGYWLKIPNAGSQYKDELAAKQPAGYRALDVMEAHLEQHEFFVNQFTIADIALYAFTNVCVEGGFSLDNHPNIRRWLQDVKNQPGHIGITGNSTT